MMTRSALSAVFMLMTAAAPAAAASDGHSNGTSVERAANQADKATCPWPAGVARCTKIAGPDRRLACFDELTGHGE